MVHECISIEQSLHCLYLCYTIFTAWILSPYAKRNKRITLLYKGRSCLMPSRFILSTLLSKLALLFEGCGAGFCRKNRISWGFPEPWWVFQCLYTTFRTLYHIDPSIHKLDGYLSCAIYRRFSYFWLLPCAFRDEDPTINVTCIFFKVSWIHLKALHGK